MEPGQVLRGELLGLSARGFSPCDHCPARGRSHDTAFGERLRFSASREGSSLFILGFQTTCKITRKVGEAPV